MLVRNVLTVEALLVAIAAKQAKMELDAAILVAEIALRDSAQKSRPARERRTA
jgi:hypothetical protein